MPRTAQALLKAMFVLLVLLALPAGAEGAFAPHAGTTGEVERSDWRTHRNFLTAFVGVTIGTPEAGEGQPATEELVLGAYAGVDYVRGGFGFVPGLTLSYTF